MVQIQLNVALRDFIGYYRFQQLIDQLCTCSVSPQPEQKNAIAILPDIPYTQILFNYIPIAQVLGSLDP